MNIRLCWLDTATERDSGLAPRRHRAGAGVSAERPILFSGPMVRAILDGRKVQTRRIVNPQPAAICDRIYRPFPHEPNNWQGIGRDDLMCWYGCCPYGQPGDRLWVRETFKKVCSGEVKNGYGELRYGTAYAADNAVIWRPHTTTIHDLTGEPKAPTGPLQFRDIPWKPAIYMPRTACRITLELTDVRVERLQEISGEDAAAEGVQFRRLDHGVPKRGDIWAENINGFRELWDSINAKRAPWASNPWVWVLCFRRAA